MPRSGYVGDSLQALVTDATLEATHALARDIVEEARDVMLTAAMAATPAKSGAVRNSWLPEPIWPHGPERWGATVRNDHWLAHLLSEGTKAHEIDPKRKRAELTPEGPRARSHVAGIHGHHMDVVAVDTAQAVIGETTYLARERWKRECEAAIDANKHQR